MIESSPHGKIDKPLDKVSVSFSELSSWRRCQFQHWLQYRHRYTPLTEKPVFKRGHGWDEVMNLHYSGLKEAQEAGAKPQSRLHHPAFKIYKARIDAILQDNPDDPSDTRELNDLLRWMYDGYLEQYGPDAEWQILEIQSRREALLTTIELPDRILAIHLKVFIDLLVAERGRGSKGRIWVVDAKSTTALGRRDLGFNDQAGLYAWIVSVHGLMDKPIFGSIFSYALARKNKAKPQPLDERFKRALVAPSEVELDEIANDAIQTAWQMYAHPLEWQPPRSPDDEMCRRRCDFVDACLANRKGHPLDRLVRRMGNEVPAWHQPRIEGVDEWA